MNIGIMGIGVYTPDTFMTAAEISEKCGIPEDVISEKFGVRKKAVPGPDDTTSSMGIKAAEAAIADAGIEAAEIDLIIWFGAQHKDYMCWLAGLKVADEIGAVNAWAFDLSAMCGSVMTGIEVARSMMLGNDNINTVLLVSGYRNGDLVDLGVKETSFMFDLGAGGNGMVLRKGYNRNVVLRSSFKGDGSFSEDCTIKYGGTKNWPLRPEDTERIHFTIDDNEQFKKKLLEKTLPNFYSVIDKSLESSGLTRKDIDYLAILHFKKSAHLAVLDELGLTEAQTIYLDKYGHTGQNDQIISIMEGIKERKIKNGDNIVLVGAGLGFVWSATVIRWGAAEN